MLTISIVVALVLDRILPILQSYRNNFPLSRYFRWVERNLLFDSLPQRLRPLVLILPAVLLIALLSVFFKVTLLALVFNVFVAFICLEPQVLNEEVDNWLGQSTRDDAETTAFPGALFGKANRSLYTVIFWFVALGPIMAVAYRLLEKLTVHKNLDANQDWNRGVIKLVAWLEWFPALISSFLFLIGGNFEAGLKQARGLPLVDSDMPALNENRLKQVGKASLLFDGHRNEQSEPEFVRRIRGLLLRTLVLWLVLVALLDYWL